MRIIFLIGRGVAAPHIVDSAAKAAEELGHSIHLEGLKSEKQDLSDIIDRFDPDLVIALDHTGIDDNFFYKNKRYYCSWFVDHPLYFVGREENNPYHLAAVTDSSFIPVLKNMGWKNICHCPLAFDPRIFFQQKNNPSHDLAYVGTFPGRFKEFQEDRNKRFGAVLNQIVDAGLHWKKQKKDLDLIEILKWLELKGKVPFLEKLDDASIGALIRLMDFEWDAYYKEQIFQELKSYSIIVHGNEKWKQVISEPLYQGTLPYGPALRSLYQSTKINLILTRAQIHKGMNQRVFDVAASGSFFLCDRSIDEVAKGMDDYVFFDSVDSLKEKVDYFLNHEKEREEIADKIGTTIRKSHTYIHRMKDFFQWVSFITGKK